MGSLHKYLLSSFHVPDAGDTELEKNTQPLSPHLVGGGVAVQCDIHDGRIEPGVLWDMGGRGCSHFA